MKYAENNRISHRQLYRQIILALTAPILLTLPGKREFTGVSGIWGVMMAMVLLTGYVFVLMRVSSYCMDPVRFMGTILGKTTGVFFLLYIIFSVIFLLDLLVDIVPVWLVNGIDKNILSFLAVAVCSFGTHRGMQKRGRMAEVSGGIFIGGILLILVFALGQCRGDYLKETITEVPWSLKYSLRSCYSLLCGMAGLSLLPFIMKEVEKRSTAGKTVLYGIFSLGLILTGTIIILPAVFGWKRLELEEFPILPLMAGADFPGNVLERFDALWMGLLLYGILFTIGSLFYYGNQVCTRTHLGTGRWWIPVLTYILLLVDFKDRETGELYRIYLENIFIPGVLILWGIMLLRGSGKRRKKIVPALFILFFVLGFSGCAAIEPEKRMYPLALGVQNADQGIKLSYGMPDLPQATGQKKEETGISETVLTIEGRNFSETDRIYNRSQEKYLDLGHLQVLLFGNNFIESENREAFLEYIHQKPAVGEDIYVFRTEDPQAVLSWDSGGTSTGEYLRGLMENRLPGEQRTGITLRDVYYQWIQNGTMPAFPEILLKGDEIEIE